jgi:hypothetical protein
MAAETIPIEVLPIIPKTKRTATTEQTIEILLTIAEQVRPLQEIKITPSVIRTAEQAQTAIAAKTTVLQDLTHQAQEATATLQLPDPTAQTQVIPAMVAVAVEEDHLAEAEEDNIYIYLNKN